LQISKNLLQKSIIDYLLFMVSLVYTLTNMNCLCHKYLTLSLFAIAVFSTGCKKENVEEPLITPSYIYGTWENEYKCGLSLTCPRRLEFYMDSTYVHSKWMATYNDPNEHWVELTQAGSKFYIKNDSLFLEEFSGFTPYKIHYIFEYKMKVEFPDNYIYLWDKI